MSRRGADAVPYWRLSGFYFFYFAALGAFLPYWPLYLQAEGYDAAEIGLLVALLPATKLVSPNLWGWLADHSDRSVLLIRLASLLTAGSFALLPVASGFSAVAAVSLIAGFFWNAPLPLFEAITLAYLSRRPSRYPRVRLWGSVGFIASVTLAGWAMDRWLSIGCLPQLILLLFVVMGLVTLTIRERSVRVEGQEGGALWSILKRPHVLAFFAVVMLIQVAHAPYYTFFSVYLKDHGYAASQTGLLWSLGVVAEITLFLLLERLLRRYRLRQILLAAIFLGVVRWWLLAWFIDQLWLLAAGQLMHAATFGAFHAVSIQLIHRYFGGAHHGKGQALYSSVGYGLGGMAGSYLSGLGWDSLGSAAVFSAASLCSLAALLLVWLWGDTDAVAGDHPKRA